MYIYIFLFFLYTIEQSFIKKNTHKHRQNIFRWFSFYILAQSSRLELVRDKNEIKKKRGDLPERDVYVEQEHYYSCDRFSQSHF